MDAGADDGIARAELQELSAATRDAVSADFSGDAAAFDAGPLLL